MGSSEVSLTAYEIEGKVNPVLVKNLPLEEGAEAMGSFPFYLSGKGSAINKYLVNKPIRLFTLILITSDP